MPKTTHTPEPWHVGDEHMDSGTLPIISADETFVAEANGSDRPEMMEANADRIVACVNACAGINPAAVPDMLAALRLLVREWDLGRTPIAGDWSKARDAIAKAVQS